MSVVYQKQQIDTHPFHPINTPYQHTINTPSDFPRPIGSITNNDPPPPFLIYSYILHNPPTRRLSSPYQDQHDITPLCTLTYCITHSKMTFLIISIPTWPIVTSLIYSYLLKPLINNTPHHTTPHHTTKHNRTFLYDLPFIIIYLIVYVHPERNSPTDFTYLHNKTISHSHTINPLTPHHTTTTITSYTLLTTLFLIHLMSLWSTTVLIHFQVVYPSFSY